MSTYAWFTANRTVRVDSIDVYVSTSGGLQISSDADDWKTVLSKDDLINAHDQGYTSEVNQLPVFMSPVSSAKTVTNGKLDMFYGSTTADIDDPTSATYGQYLLTSVKQTDKSSYGITDTGKYERGYYIAFDVFLRLDSADSDLYLSGSVRDTIDDTNLTISDANERGLSNAARVAILKCPDSAVVAKSGTRDSMMAIPTTGTAFLWEPNYDTHVATGVSNYTSLFRTPASGSPTAWPSIYGVTVAAGADNGAVPYDGLKAEFTDIALGNAIVEENPSYVTRLSNGSGIDFQSKKAETVPSFNLQGIKQGIQKYRIYMWVEGQDIDCENEVSGTNMVYNMKFSLSPFTGSGTGTGTGTGSNP
jgi:hypothetical protein